MKNEIKLISLFIIVLLLYSLFVVMCYNVWDFNFLKQYNDLTRFIISSVITVLIFIALQKLVEFLINKFNLKE